MPFTRHELFGYLHGPLMKLGRERGCSSVLLEFFFVDDTIDIVLWRSEGAKVGTSCSLSMLEKLDDPAAHMVETLTEILDRQRPLK